MIGRLQHALKTVGGSNMKEFVLSAEEMLNRCYETKQILHTVSAMSMKVERAAANIGKEKRTRRGRMSFYRPARERIGHILPLLVRLIELWDIPFQLILESEPPVQRGRKFKTNYVSANLNKTFKDLQIAVSLNLPMRDLDKAYFVIQKSLASYLNSWSTQMGPIHFISHIFYKFRKQLGYAEQ